MATASTPGLTVGQICHSSLGGSSKVACRVANALARRGHESHILSLEPVAWQLHEDVIQHSCKAHRIPDNGSLYWDWSDAEQTGFCDLLSSVLKERRFDVVHYHYTQPFAGITSTIARKLGAAMPPCIGTIHGTDLTRYVDDRSSFDAVSKNFAGTRELTTVSTYMADLFRKVLPSHLPLKILPNFVEDDWPKGKNTPTGANCPKEPVILHVSNYRAVKDTALLEKLFLHVRDLFPVQLWLVGDGPELPALLSNLGSSSAADAVRCWGASTNPEQYFQQADLFFSTSKSEGFGLAVLEAMASGLPVAATAVGGIPELIEHNVTGIHIDPADLNATAQKLVSFLQSPDELDGIRRNSLAVADKYRESSTIAKYEKLYYSLGHCHRRELTA